MNGYVRWVLVLVAALAVVALVAYARGPEHHRGPRQVGALGAAFAVPAAHHHA